MGFDLRIGAKDVIKILSLHTGQLNANTHANFAREQFDWTHVSIDTCDQSSVVWGCPHGFTGMEWQLNDWQPIKSDSWWLFKEHMWQRIRYLDLEINSADDEMTSSTKFHSGAPGGRIRNFNIAGHQLLVTVTHDSPRQEMYHLASGRERNKASVSQYETLNARMLKGWIWIRSFF